MNNLITNNGESLIDGSLLESILFISSVTINGRHDQIDNFKRVLSRKIIRLSNLIENSTKKENQLSTTIKQISLIKNSVLNGYLYTLYFESESKFYLLFLQNNNLSKIIVSDKSIGTFTYKDIEMSKNGFEIIDMLYFDDTIIIRPEQYHS